MKILLLGKRGMLGSEFLKIMEEQNFDFQAPTHHELDLLDFNAVDRFLAREYFDRIIYCAAYTDVEGAEIERGACERMNVAALQNLLTHKQPIIHFSTDYVFSAPNNIAIPENYPREPLNFYGESKKQAEIVLETSGIDFWNIRTSWLFGMGRENFLTKIWRAAKENDVLEIVGDQIGRPTYTKDLAKFVLDYFIVNQQDSGHYHIQNSGDPVSWADFAKYFLEKKGWQGAIKTMSSEDRQYKAERPKNSVFMNTKLPEGLRDWKEAVDEFAETV
jgi:dTDP-4-dehydrorhamnose reductase